MGIGSKVVQQPAGYSGTPLQKKLGLKPRFTVRLLNAPGNYFELLGNLPEDLSFNDNTGSDYDLIHFFTKQLAELIKTLPSLKGQIKANGAIWVSWPKKASKVATDITENFIRDYAISIGLVDVKVCAIDETWSALKLVIPVKDR